MQTASAFSSYWWGSETANAVPGGLQHRTMDELLDFIAEQGFNTVRLLLNHHSVLVNGKVNHGGKLNHTSGSHLRSHLWLTPTIRAITHHHSPPLSIR